MRNKPSLNPRSAGRKHQVCLCLFLCVCIYIVLVALNIISCMFQCVCKHTHTHIHIHIHIHMESIICAETLSRHNMKVAESEHRKRRAHRNRGQVPGAI